MSGYLIEPIRDNKDFKGAVRNVNNGQNGQNGKKGVFKGDGSLDALFSRLWERLKGCWTSHISGFLLEPIRDNEDFKGAVRNVNNSQKKAKMA